MTPMRKLLRRLSAEDGYSVTELLTVLAILATVVTPIVLLFASGSKAQIEMNQRFQAQQNARLALAKLRRDVHCAASATTVPAASANASRVTLTPPASGCGTALTTATTWCTLPVATSRWALYRKPGTTCDTAGVKVADYLTAANVFVYTPRSTSRLATLRVDFPVDVDAKAGSSYRLQDELALRRSGRGA